MSVSHRYVIVTGIPGCGKSTVGNRLAEHLNTTYIDKDEILESYFAQLESVDEGIRHRLSRAADKDFQSLALNCATAVLDSFWRHPSADTQSGTPSNWLETPEIHAVEILCKCAPELAARRFLRRSRHPGHLDTEWSHASLLKQSHKLNLELPLGVGTLIEVDTTHPVAMEHLATTVRSALYV